MRSFVALELPAPVREAVAGRVRQAAPLLPPARWVRPESLHLTLRFLGEAEERALDRLAEPLAEAFAASRVPPVRLAGGGCFPPHRPARVAWIAVEPSAPLRELQARVVGAVDEPLGLPAERRPFSPHVTVARCRRPWPRAAVERFERAFAAAFGEPFEVVDGSLMESRLGAGGARYRRLAAYPLGSAAGTGGDDR